MSLRVSFVLEDNDLKHFRLIMREARKAAAGVAPEDIVAAAEDLLRVIGDTGAPEFVRERLDKLRLMIDMLTDSDWRLPHQESNRVLNALAYFAEPEDLIPDSIPGLGFLDDAIMIELVSQELEHEIQAYRDFVVYRAAEACRKGEDANALERADWLEERRQQLHSRMRRRRRRGGGGGGGGLPPPPPPPPGMATQSPRTDPGASVSTPESESRPGCRRERRRSAPPNSSAGSTATGPGRTLPREASPHRRRTPRCPTPPPPPRGGAKKSGSGSAR